jgi:integrase
MIEAPLGCEWKNIEESFKARASWPMAGSRSRGRVGETTAHGLRYNAATILLNHVGKDLREIQALLRHKNIPLTVRYTHVGYEQTRQTAEALSQALERPGGLLPS